MKTSVYEALKSEQSSRIVFRDSALYINFVTSLTILGIFVETEDRKVLVLIALANVVFASLYFINDYYVSALSKFCKSVENQSNSWESFHRTGAGYKIQKIMRFSLEAGSFLISPIFFIFIVRCSYTYPIITLLAFSALAIYFLGVSATFLIPSPQGTHPSEKQDRG